MSDWSSDVCSSDLLLQVLAAGDEKEGIGPQFGRPVPCRHRGELAGQRAEADAAESNRSAALAPRPVDQHRDPGAPGGEQPQEAEEIGRESCGERVLQYV